jgi:hypothetical protein
VCFFRCGTPASPQRKERPTTFANCYDDRSRAEAYATLEFKNTYHLAYRNIK